MKNQTPKLSVDFFHDQIAERMEAMLLPAVGEERHAQAIELACEIAHTFAGAVKEFILNEPPRGMDAEELDRSLCNVTNRAAMAGTDFNEIMRGLQLHIAFWWSTVCPGCRRESARELERNIPELLAMADKRPMEGAEEDCARHRLVH
jgi:hypothetical protein